MITRSTVVKKIVDTEILLKQLSKKIGKSRPTEQIGLEAERVKLMSRFETLKELYDEISEFPYELPDIPYITNK